MALLRILLDTFDEEIHASNIAAEWVMGEY